jgi:hypothetical protein
VFGLSLVINRIKKLSRGILKVIGLNFDIDVGRGAQGQNFDITIRRVACEASSAKWNRDINSALI